jgi:hypothetical protein
MRFLGLAIAVAILVAPSIAKAEWVKVANDNNSILSIYDGKTKTGMSKLGKMSEFFIKVQMSDYNVSYAKVTAVCRSNLFYMNVLNPDGSLQLSKPISQAPKGSLIEYGIQHACK